MAPPISAFSRPVSSWSKPAPSARMGASLPSMVVVPWVCVVIPQRICSSVVLPAPLRPMMPTHSPFCTAKLTSRSTQCSL